jgi:hypothetical protein
LRFGRGVGLGCGSCLRFGCGVSLGCGSRLRFDLARTSFSIQQSLQYSQSIVVVGTVLASAFRGHVAHPSLIFFFSVVRINQ